MPARAPWALALLPPEGGRLLEMASPRASSFQMVQSKRRQPFSNGSLQGEGQTERSFCLIPSSPSLSCRPLTHPPLGHWHCRLFAPDRLRKGLVWAVRTGGPPGCCYCCAAAAAAMRLVLLLSGGRHQGLRGSRGGRCCGQQARGARGQQRVEPSQQAGHGQLGAPAICSRFASRFCWIRWIIW